MDARWTGSRPTDSDDAATLEGCASTLYDQLSSAYSPMHARFILQAIARFPRETLAVAELAPHPAPGPTAVDVVESQFKPRRRLLRPRYG